MHKVVIIYKQKEIYKAKAQSLTKKKEECIRYAVEVGGDFFVYKTEVITFD